MVALSNHLRPAPYHYGLLTSRILGKLGGKNRYALQEPMNLDIENTMHHRSPLNMKCSWASVQNGTNAIDEASEKEEDFVKFMLPLPLEQAVKVLEMITSVPRPSVTRAKIDKTTDDLNNLWDSFSTHFKVEELDMKEFENDLIGKIEARQAHSAFIVIRSALSAVIDLSGENATDAESLEEIQKRKEEGSRHNNWKKDSKTASLKLIGMGLFYATAYDLLKDEAIILLEGLVTHLVTTVEKHSCDVKYLGTQVPGTHLGSNGSQKDEKLMDSPVRDAQESSGKFKSLSPFGQFVLTGFLKRSKIDFFIINEIIVDALAERKNALTERALKIISYIASMANRKSVEKNEKNAAELFIENLLSSLCQACLSLDWNSRGGIFDGICYLLSIMESRWCLKFDVNLMHVAIFSLKDSSSIVTQAERQSLNFYFRIIYFLFGSSNSWQSNTSNHIHDVLSIPKDPLGVKESDTSKTSLGPSKDKPRTMQRPSDNILGMLLSELTSAHHVVR